MALIVPITQDDGTVTTYHRVRKIVSCASGCVAIIVSSYEDEGPRRKEGRDGIQYVRSKTYFTDEMDSPGYEDAYNWLKSNVPEFENAEDQLNDL